ncbi:MAG TPA: CHAD domain-containing protein [Tepidisphaeraceae bacterium]|jgi:CHAD domain-containing protein|nr:CHAD domain-containing protein [Tepidisphaeraceae bacterium]
MSFELKRKETVPEGIRRVVCERIEKALETLNGSSRKAASDEAVHEARKQFKQVRSALRVVRGELGGNRFDRENRTFRDAGRPLSEVRDAKVMVQTLDELAAHHKGQLAAGSFKYLHSELEARRRDVRKRVLDEGRAARAIVREVSKSSRRVEGWPLKHNGWKAVSPGLRQTYAQGREAMQESLRDGSDEAYHEWRKRAKDLRYAIELLARPWPEAMQPLADAVHHLTDVLGQDHDLAVLESLVKGELKDVPDPEREMLEPLAAQRRTELKEEAAELGRKIYAEQEDAFIDRLHGYWKAWE